MREQLNRPGAHALLALLALGVVGGIGIWAASKTLDLDGKTANGAESSATLTVLSTYPAKIENKVTNKAIGDAFTFFWASAGPGGFSGSVPAGTTLGVGSKWTYQTTQTLYSFTGNACGNDLCFTKTAGPDPVTTRGPFGVPGRSLVSSGVTVSTASLTSSLITFFSPPQTVASATQSISLLGGGQVGYTSTYHNNSGQVVSLVSPAYPPGCCNEPHQLNCDGTCVDYLTDPDNCGSCGNICAAGTFCSTGSCVTLCPAGLTACGDACIDLQSDPQNCGACGNVCGENSICTGGTCVECRPPTGTACDNRCVNTHTDSENCGGCGINCDLLCPSTGHGTCSQGQSCFCLQAPSFKSGLLTAAPLATEAPLCEIPEVVQLLQPGQTVSNCQARSVLAKEISNQLTVCGDSVPGGQADCAAGQTGSQGTYQELVPDLTRPIGNTWVAPVSAEVRADTSGNGILEPGETGDVRICVNNAGPVTLTGAAAVLSSPAIDLTDDGVANAVAVGIPIFSSPYPDIVGIPTAGSDCANPPAPPTPSCNSILFRVSIPTGHPGDVVRPYYLHFTGTSDGSPFDQDVPVTLGIAGVCNAAAPDGNFDGLDGLASPMAKLVPEGDAVPFPPKAFQQGKSRPMKLRLLCGGVNLTGGMIDPPQIVALREATLGPIDITQINLNDDANSNDPFFRYSNGGQQWSYAMRTKELPRGSYIITIQIANQKNFQTGFVLY